LLPKYWSASEAPASVFTCSSEKRCPGGAAGLCPPAAIGRACATCTDGFVWKEDKGGCIECASIEKSKVLFPFLPLLLTPLIVCLMYKMFADKYPKWGFWKNGCVSTIFIVLNHYQIIAMLGGVNIQLPTSSRGMFKGVGFTTNAATLFSPGCAGVQDFKSNLIMKTAAPAVVLGLFTAVWAASQAFAKFGLAMEKNRCFNSGFSLMFTFFAGICEMALQLFKCGQNPNGTKTLVADRSIICGEADWNGSLVVGLIAVALWVVGIGSTFVWAVLTVPKKIF